MSETAKGGIPLIAENTVGGFRLYNQAMQQIDAVMFGTVLSHLLTAPPASPSEGDLYIPKATASGAWATYEDYLAHFYNGSWHFYAPTEGLRMWFSNVAPRALYVYSNGSWQGLVTL